MSPIVKRKGEKFTLPSKYLLLILSILCALMMFVTFTTTFLSGFLSNVAGFMIVPFQSGISKVGGYIDARVKQFSEIQRLLDENERLRAQVDALTTENTNLQQDRFELVNLRSLFELDETYEDYDTIGARIISKDAGNYYHTFVINKGTDDGIQIDMNVIAGSGLVGRVISAGHNWAKVSTIINDNHNVSGMVLSTADNLIVSGDLSTYADGLISFSKLVDTENKVVVGDKIVTSNISDKYLPGILVGYISTINTDSNNLTKSGMMTPAVDFYRLDEVLVITELKQTVKEDS